MASNSFSFYSSVKISLALFLLCLLTTTTIAAAAAAATVTAKSHPSPVKCLHHHASLTTCARFLLKDDDDDHVVTPSLPTQACCKNYEEIFRSGTPACLCRYLHPERLKTSFNVTKLMWLHDLCPSSNTVPLYDLCVGGKVQWDLRSR